MGYTHYWQRRGTRPVSKRIWTQIVNDCEAIVNISGVKVAFEYDEGGKAPEFSADSVRFNGIGEGGHETFHIERKLREAHYDGDDRAFDFCKTARKGYDLPVSAILAYLDSVHPEIYSVSSDGQTADWQAGVNLARKALPRYANVIQTPRDVLDKDRYESYDSSSSMHQLAWGYDGVLYIERKRDRARIALPFKESDDFRKWYVANSNKGRRFDGSFGPGEYERTRLAMTKHIWNSFQKLGVLPPLPVMINPAMAAANESRPS